MRLPSQSGFSQILTQRVKLSSGTSEMMVAQVVEARPVMSKVRRNHVPAIYVVSTDVAEPGIEVMTTWLVFHWAPKVRSEWRSSKWPPMITSSSGAGAHENSATPCETVMRNSRGGDGGANVPTTL